MFEQMSLTYASQDACAMGRCTSGVAILWGTSDPTGGRFFVPVHGMLRKNICEAVILE